MKTKEIAEKYGVDKSRFENYVRNSDLPYADKITGMVIEDKDVERCLKAYKNYLYRIAEEEKAAAEEAVYKQQLMSEMLISSGFHFEGYRIVKYSGYISGDDAVQIPRGSGHWFSGTNHGENLTNALVQIRRQALLELKEAAYNLGCNAVIGVDFDYITLEPETANSSGGTTYEPYVICVTANGNAVVIEKDEEANRHTHVDEHSRFDGYM